MSETPLTEWWGIYRNMQLVAIDSSEELAKHTACCMDEPSELSVAEIEVAIVGKHQFLTLTKRVNGKWIWKQRPTGAAHE